MNINQVDPTLSQVTMQQSRLVKNENDFGLSY